MAGIAEQIILDVALWDGAAGDAQPSPSALHYGLPWRKGLASVWKAL